jgi:ribose/xylose/arabinose/galactoside ABC-type transport system permease subunit
MGDLMTEPAAFAASSAQERPAARQLWRSARDSVGTQNLSLILALAALVTIIGTQTDRFFVPENLVNVAQSVVIVGIVAAAATAVIISGGLDLSVGSVAGLSGVVGALVVNSTSAWLGIAAGIATGFGAGILNGIIVTALRVNPVISTLATLSALRGLSFLIAPGGKPVGVVNGTFTDLGSGRVNLGFDPHIPYTVFLLVAVVVGMHVLLRYTATGRAIYAVGGNERAARLAGIRLTRMRLLLYGLSGAAAGLAGVVLAAQTFIGAPDSSTDLLFDVITACFLGGCALEGGKGTVVGVLLAVVLLGVLDNGMSLLGIATFYQLVAKGLLLVLAVAVQQWRAHHAERVQLRS